MNVWHFAIFLLAIAAVGQAEDFNPTVRTVCQNGYMNVSILTNAPYEGLVYAEGRREQCNVLGAGGLYSSFVIPLTDINRCALVYQPEHEEYFAVLHVREHAKIILDQDRTFNVSCRRGRSLAPASAQPLSNTRGTSQTQTESNGVMMGVYDLTDPEATAQKVHQTIFGHSYELRLTSTKRNDFVVNRCSGFAGMNHTIELSDSNGCSQSSDLMTNFVYDPMNGLASAQLRSMFRFPEYGTVHLQCEVTMCARVCNRVNCDRRRDAPFDQLAGRQVFGGTQTQFTSTTVKVDDVGTRTQLSVKEDCSREYRVMAYLCVLFAVLFLFAVVTNIVFCYMGGFLCYQASKATGQTTSKCSAASPKAFSEEYMTTEDSVYTRNRPSHIDAYHQATVNQNPNLKQSHDQRHVNSPNNQHSPSVSSGGDSDRQLIQQRHSSPSQYRGGTAQQIIHQQQKKRAHEHITSGRVYDHNLY